MEKLNLSIGILSYHSTKTLHNTLHSYLKLGLLDMVNDVHILFQQTSAEDVWLSQEFDVPYIHTNENIGIGKGFLTLATAAETQNLLLLEHDWELIEDEETTYKRLEEGITLLNKGIHSVRYRHRKRPGYPLYSQVHKGNELNYYDREIEATSPHLLDSIHWIDNPTFPQLQKEGEYFVTTSQWGNWTNNPTMYKKEFYIDTVTPFAGIGTELEGNISKWWNRQDYKVAHGEGLFTHNDIQKYGQA